MLLSLLSGYFKYVFILFFIVIFHELGHLFISNLLGYNSHIIIYPFGGITMYDGYLNIPIYKEFLILIGGPLFQIILYIFLLILYKNNLINDYTFGIISLLHKSLLYFNFLPIVPLDGSKLLILLLEIFLPYKKSNILIIYISYITIFILAMFEKRIIFIILSLLLMKSIIEEALNIDIKFNKFLLERYMYNFRLLNGKLINNIESIRRERVHKIICNGKVYEEKEYLTNLYKKSIKP